MENYLNFLRGYYYGNPQDTDTEGKDTLYYKAGKACNMADSILSWGGIIAIIILLFKALKKVLNK